MVPFDRAHTTLYSSSIIRKYVSIYYRFWYSRIFVENRYPLLVFGSPLGIKPSDLRNNPWWRKTRLMVKEFRWYVQQFWYKARVWQTSRRNCRGIYALQHTVESKNSSLRPPGDIAIRRVCLFVGWFLDSFAIMFVRSLANILVVAWKRRRDRRYSGAAGARTRRPRNQSQRANHFTKAA